MTTAIQGTYTGYTINNLTQSFNYTEGGAALTLAPITLTTGLNYSRVYTLTFTIQKSQFDPTPPVQLDGIRIACSNLNGMPLTKTGNVYTLSSEYINSEGVKLNNHAYLKLALKALSIQFTNTDINESFVVMTSFTDGTGVTTGQFTVTTTGSSDVIGNNQTLSIPMAANGQSLITLGGVNLAINDPDQANKTYRVTYTVNDVTNGTGSSDAYLSVNSDTWAKSKVLTGTQASINTAIASSGTFDGLTFYLYNPEFQGAITVSYVQEVLTSTEPGVVVPYIQEVGTLTFNTVYTAPFAINAGITYSEDASTTFDLGNITDNAGTYYNLETCGAYQGYNCYTLTATVAGTFTAENPVILTYAGDTGLNNTVTFTGSKIDVNAAINSLTLIPPADYTGNLTIDVVLTRGNTPKTIYTGSLTATCTATHADADIINSSIFSVGANTINFGAITDLAVGKNYTVTLDAQLFPSTTRGALSDPTGLGVWSATGGAYGYGRLTLTGTKAQINDSLDGLVYTTVGGATTADNQTFVYTQTQITNNLLQVTSTISIANDIIWNTGNGIHLGQNAFVYDQETVMTWDLATLNGTIDEVTTYTAKLVFSTPLSVANEGSVTGWTRETDYIWTKTGVRSALNTALDAVVFNTPIGLVANFTLDIQVYNGATKVADTADVLTTKTVYIRNLSSATWTASALTYDQDAAKTWSNLLTLNNFGNNTYTIQLKTNTATGGAITGWTTVDSTTFEKTDTRANLQTGLNSLTFTGGLSFVSNFIFSVKAFRSGIQIYDGTLNTKNISIGMVYGFTWGAGTLNYLQDNPTNWYMAGLSSNFGTGPYTVQLTTSVDTGGTITGWTKINATTFEKTDTGPNLAAALAAVVFRGGIAFGGYPDYNGGSNNFNFNIKAYKSATLLFDSTAIPSSRSVFIYGRYDAQWTATALTYDQDDTEVWNLLSLGNFVSSDIYTLELTTNVDTGATITGWTKTGNVYTKTDTATNLQAAVAALQYVATITFVSNFTFSFIAYREGVIVFNGPTAMGFGTKPVSIGVTYSVAARNVTFAQDITTTLDLVTESSNFNNSKTYTAEIEISNFTLANFGSFAGWTSSGSKASKTDTGTNIMASLNAISFTPIPSFISSTPYNLYLYRSGQLVAQTWPTSGSMTATDVYAFSAPGTTIDYGSTPTITNWTLTGAAWNPATSYQINITANQVTGNTVATLSGASWTNITTRQIRFTGTPAEIQAALTSGFVITQTPYNTSSVTLSVTVYRDSTTLVYSNNVKTYTIANKPGITTASVTYLPYYVINTARDYDGYQLTGSFSPTESYRIKIRQPINAFYGRVTGTMSATTTTWTYDTTTSSSYVYAYSNWMNNTQLADALADLKFTADSTSITGYTASAYRSMQISLQSNPTTPAVTGSEWNREIKNGARINPAGNDNICYSLSVAANGSYPNNNFGSLTVDTAPVSTPVYVVSGTITVKFVGDSLISLPEWTDEGGNVYSITGAVDAVDLLLSAVLLNVNFTSFTQRDYSLNIYQSGVLLSNQVVRVTKTT